MWLRQKGRAENLRYNRIAFEAAKQSGRGVVPQVELPVTYKQMLADAARNDAAFFCYEAGGEPLLSRLGGAETIGLITGSEGGFPPRKRPRPAKRDAYKSAWGRASCVVRPRRWRRSLR